MPVLYKDIEHTEITAAYRGYAELLLQHKVGPEISKWAAFFLCPNGPYNKMAAATSKRALHEALHEAFFLTFETKELAAHFALRSKDMHKAYAVIDHTGGFYRRKTRLTNVPDSAICKEQTAYLNPSFIERQRRRFGKIYTQLATINDYFPEIQPPTLGTILISPSNPFKVVTMWGSDASAVTVRRFLSRDRNVVPDLDFEKIKFTDNGDVIVEKATRDAFACLAASTRALNVSPHQLQFIPS